MDFLCSAGKKSTYAKSVGPWFVENRLSPEAQAVYRTGFESTKPTNEKVVVSYLNVLRP